jgi:hypothetical protein
MTNDAVIGAAHPLQKIAGQSLKSVAPRALSRHLSLISAWQRAHRAIAPMRAVRQLKLLFRGLLPELAVLRLQVFPHPVF